MLPLSDATFRRIADLVYETIGISFDQNKKTLVASRLGPRLQKLQLDDFETYYRTISSGEHGGEFQMAVDLLTTNETYFFREPAHYDLIQAELKQSRPRSLSAWSAASSFGDEAYSLAMLLCDLQTAGVVGPNWSILGTDISDRVLRTATQAIYPQDRLRNVSHDRLRRYCLRGEGECEGLVQLKPELTRNVRFGQLNLCQPFNGLGPFDLVMLRNVLIYFDAQTKAQVVGSVLTQLRPGGLFFVGTAEGRVPGTEGLQVLAPGVFRKAAP